MDSVKLRHGDRVLICDGRKALIFENRGDGQHVDLQLQDKHERSDASTAEIGTDAPGRVHASVGTARSAMEQTDWHALEEEGFLKGIAGELNSAIEQQRNTRMVVVAPPRALAVLRGAWSKPAKDTIVAEISKDLVRVPMNEIEAYFTAPASDGR